MIFPLVKSFATFMTFNKTMIKMSFITCPLGIHCILARCYNISQAVDPHCLCLQELAIIELFSSFRNLELAIIWHCKENWIALNVFRCIWQRLNCVLISVSGRAKVCICYAVVRKSQNFVLRVIIHKPQILECAEKQM